MNQDRISPAEIASVERLKTIEKRYGRSRKKIWFVLAIPSLWLLGAIVANTIDELWAWEALVGWCLMTTFLMGVYVLYQVPSTDDAVHWYSQEILPGLLIKLGVETVRVARRHNLSMKIFLESGLYYDKYSAISREDSIQGRINGADFGMYEIAVQTGSTMMSAQAGTTASVRTNQFYGWFIVVNTAQVNGFHFITLRKKLTRGESDDWHEKTISHWEKDQVMQKVSTGNSRFDDLLLVNSDRPESLRQLLNSSALDFLVYIAETSSNAFAISIQRGNIYILIGHEKPEFRKVPEGDFTTQLSPEMVADAKWFVELIRGLVRTLKVSPRHT